MRARTTTRASTPRLARNGSYGPQVSTLPDSIGVWVARYEESLVFEMTGENPYLFSMSSSWERGLSSSAWTQAVKAVMERWAGVPAPPKQLRAAFCTYLRSSDDAVDEELLASAAHAMKHQDRAPHASVHAHSPSSR